MADNQTKSDDLIAELAKLMASDGQNAAAQPKPSVIKLPPLDSAPPSAPVRIPGMEQKRPAAVEPRPPAPSSPPVSSSAPAVRIPGMERPVGLNDPIPPAPTPRPASQFDFGKPPAAATVPKPEPLSNWQAHEAPRHLGSLPQPQPAAKPAPAAAVPPPVARLEPQLPPAAPQAAPVAAPPPLPAAKAAPADDSFGFDFGFGTGTGSPSSRDSGDAPEESDPIADLIAAELDAAIAVEDDDAEAPDVVGTTPDLQAAPKEAPSVAVPVAPAGAKLMTPLPQRPISIKPVSIPNKPVETQHAPVPSAPDEGRLPVEPAPAAPVATTPKVELDPIDEIESLIGEAVRVELGQSEPVVAAPAPLAAKPSAPFSRATPVVPPLTTGFAPRRSGLRESEPQVQAAEAAILAAAAASGRDVGHVESPALERDDEERSYKRMKVKPPRTRGIPDGMRQFVGIGVAAVLLLAAGFGLYWVLGMGGSDPADAPVLTADASPAKVEPTAPPAASGQTSGSVVFGEIDGVANTAEEALVSRDETAGAAVTEVARVTPPAEEAGEGGLANRKVRTVTVRPDGTIVSGDEAVAGTQVLPVDRPNVPEIPGGQLEPSSLLAAVADSEAGQAASNTLTALVPDSGSLTAAAPAPVEVASTPAAGAVFDASLVAPRPMPRPSSRANMVGGGSQASAAPAQVAAAPAQQPATQVSNRGGAYVQLSSQRTESEAAQSLRTMQSRLAGSLNGATLEIRRVDLGAKGIWHRVVLPVNSFQDATQACASIKSRGGDCVAING